MEGLRPNLRELELLVVWIHRLNLRVSWSAEALYYFYKLVNRVVAREHWLANQQFSHHAANRPHIYLSSVLLVAKNKLRCSIVP